MMDIALVRVDSRLVHGQIIEAWVPYLKIRCIYVANDEVANDFFRETVMKLAVPREVEVLFSSVDEFSQTVPYRRGSGKKTLVLFERLSDALRAYRQGFTFPALNVGNIYDDHYCYRLSACVQLNEEEALSLKELLANGVNVELQRIPKDRRITITTLSDLMEEGEE